MTTPPRKLPTVQRGPTSLYSLAQLHAETFFAHGQAVTLLADYGRGYSYAEIARMIQFAQAFPEEAIVVTLSQQLRWSHFHARLPIKDPLTSAPKIQSHGLGGIEERHYDRHDYMPEKRAALQQWVQRFAGG